MDENPATAAGHRRRPRPGSRRIRLLMGTVPVLIGAGLGLTATPVGAVPTLVPAPPPIDLGTLGGPTSSATAVQGTLVVGTSTNAAGQNRAFWYDLAKPVASRRMRDFGTLGGTTATAVAISGSVVVGSSATAQGQDHAFAYDFAEPVATRRMRDLGTLGGPTSYAIAVSDRLVVGTSTTATGATRAFVYDLAQPAATRHMVDLGTLGGASAFPTGVSGRLVVGESDIGGGAHHAFAYDVPVPPATGRLRDLGTLGGSSSTATAVSGRLVVGRADSAGGDHAFAYDLAAATPSMRDLGTLGGDHSQALAVYGRVVVGSAATQPGIVHDGVPAGFVIDLRERTPVMRGIGGGGRYAEISDVSNRMAVGWTVAGVERGFAYDLQARTLAFLDTLGGSDSQASAVSGRIVVGLANTPAGGWHATAWVFPAPATGVT
jgi:probable HAF family extracellular repeat protein